MSRDKSDVMTNVMPERIWIFGWQNVCGPSLYILPSVHKLIRCLYSTPGASRCLDSELFILINRKFQVTETHMDTKVTYSVEELYG